MTIDLVTLSCLIKPTYPVFMQSNKISAKKWTQFTLPCRHSLYWFDRSTSPPLFIFFLLSHRNPHSIYSTTVTCLLVWYVSLLCLVIPERKLALVEVLAYHGLLYAAWQLLARIRRDSHTQGGGGDADGKTVLVLCPITDGAELSAGHSHYPIRRWWFPTI